MASLGEKRLFLLDMDGTIYLDEDLFPGTLPFLEAVRAAGGRYLFLTNNSSKSVDAYIAKLGRMGISDLRGRPHRGPAQGTRVPEVLRLRDGELPGPAS